VPIINVNGSPLSLVYAAALVELVVDQSLHIPDMFMLRFADPELDLIESGTFALGAAVNISVQGRGATSSVILIEGEVTGLEPTFLPTGDTMLLVRGYSKNHRLHFGRKTRTFLKQTDSQIASKIASEAGLKASVDNSTVKHDYLIQWNQTDMEFLTARANRIGFDLYMEKGSLCFKKANNERATGPTLDFGEGDLASFRVNVSAQRQVGNAVVAGWDVNTKKPIVGTSQKGTTGDLMSGESTLRGQVKSLGAGNAKDYVINGGVVAQDDAQAMSVGLIDDHNREFVEAEGVCAGNPNIKAGVTITIKSMGKVYSGKYFVTSASHIYTEDGYYTSFTVNGRRPNTIHHLLGNENGREAEPRIDGVVSAIVTQNKDPDDLGRVKVKFPWLSEQEESNWARVAMPMAGPQRGILFMPEINDEVLVAFEHGNPNRPYVVGSVWNGKDKPPISVNKYLDKGVVQRVIRTREGHEILLDDSTSAPMITIIDKGKKDKIVFDAKLNEITIEAGGNMTIKAGGNITISAQGNISIDAKGKFDAKGTGGCNVESPAAVTVKGTGSFSVESNGSGAVKASVLQVQATGPTTVKGNPVMIN
jgi:uncharacterized protein involved in type VI secretion and phage assembly